MKTSILTKSVLALALTIGSTSFAYRNKDVNNYKGAVQGLMNKLDRNYSVVGTDDPFEPGAIALIEKVLGAMNHYGITVGAQREIFASMGPSPCNVASPQCEQIKIIVRPTHFAGESTLFDVNTQFDYDIVTWRNIGQGFERFVEGVYSPGAIADTGRLNMMLISCGGCSTVGHAALEWEATLTERHYRAQLYDTAIDGGAYGQAIIDAKQNLVTGDVKVAASSKNTCSSVDAAQNDSICSAGGDHQAGYTQKLHYNFITKRAVYVIGLATANNSTAVPTIDAMCIKADGTEDVTGAECIADNVYDFNGITPYSVSNAPSGFQAWPFPDITDVPTF